MQEQDLAPHFEELKRALAGKVTEETLFSELKNYVFKYHTDVVSAKKAIIRKYGGPNIGFVTSADMIKKIENLTGEEQNVSIIAKVVFCQNKKINVRSGEKDVTSGTISDETGSVSFTDWSCRDLQNGCTYLFKNCYCRKWNDTVQVNAGVNSSIEESSEKIESTSNVSFSSTPTELCIGEIKNDSKRITVVGRIQSLKIREVETVNGKKTIYSGTIADGTGEIQYSAWNDFSLSIGKTYRIVNAYIKLWRGIPQINMGDYTRVSEADTEIGENEVSQGNEKMIGDLIKNNGGIDVIVRGAVVGIAPKSGIIKRCSQCNRVTINDRCMVHETAQSVPDIRTRIVIDDGTGSITTDMNRDYTEKFTGISLDNAIEFVRNHGEDAIVEEIGSKLYIKRLKVRGNAIMNEYGLKIEATEISNDVIDVENETKELLKKIEGTL
ncbi:MAG: hypothetical protein MJZ03_02230 [archaeon]|nr:hypothetical protein [archaeon]